MTVVTVTHTEKLHGNTIRMAMEKVMMESNEIMCTKLEVMLSEPEKRLFTTMIPLKFMAEY